MDKLIIEGGKKLRGDVRISGAKNVALKVCFASLLTDEPIKISNVPDIQDVHSMYELLAYLGVESRISGHRVELIPNRTAIRQIPLDIGARLRTTSLALGPLLARFHTALIPNPGGCRIGARPINRHIDAIRKMGAEIEYNSSDGYFHATCGKLYGAEIEFDKNSHTGTEAVILAAVLAQGQTVIQNAAEEVEIDDLIACLNMMGADIKRSAARQITINGVEKLKGTDFTIMSDRNEEITYAVAAAVTGGQIRVHGSQTGSIAAFLESFTRVGGLYRKVTDDVTEYSVGSIIKPLEVTTGQHPGFMTDWQGPFALLLTQADGVSVIHETVFENRFAYVSQLRKMGADIEFFQPQVKNPETFYNFKWNNIDNPGQAIRITGPTKLHNAVLEINDLRAGATILLAALSANGISHIFGVEQIDRGYEAIETRLQSLGAIIQRVKEDL